MVVVTQAARPTSAAAVAELRRLGQDPLLLTGDGPGAANGVADGITTVVAEALPTEKVEVTERLLAEDRVVTMIGDGVSNAAALAPPDLGFAMGSGSDIAMSAADITLVRPDLTAAADAVHLPRRHHGNPGVGVRLQHPRATRGGGRGSRIPCSQGQ